MMSGMFLKIWVTTLKSVVLEISFHIYQTWGDYFLNVMIMIIILCDDNVYKYVYTTNYDYQTLNYD